MIRGRSRFGRSLRSYETRGLTYEGTKNPTALRVASVSYFTNDKNRRSISTLPVDTEPASIFVVVLAMGRSGYNT